MEKRVIIIGGGMAGLCAGCYLQMNGYRVTIYEMNATPGGVCTSWRRGVYKIDLCIHWLVGSGPRSSFHDRWAELIAIDEMKFINHNEYFRVEDGKGNHISVFSDLDMLEEEFITKAPEDKEEILAFICAVRKLATLQLPNDEAIEVANIWHRLQTLMKMLPYWGTLQKYLHLSCSKYSVNFKNPLLKKVIENLPAPEAGILFGMMTLTWFHNQTAGYPVGGSLNFVQQIAEKYTSLGGKIEYNAKVNKILVLHDTAIGIVTANEEHQFAEYIISASDGHTTLFDMLDNKYINEKLTRVYENYKTFPSLVFVSIGVKKDLSAHPHMLLLPLDVPLVIDPETELNNLLIHNHSYDRSLAPQGSTLLTFMLETYNYDYWDNLFKQDSAIYEQEKQRIASEIIDILEKRFGDIKDHVEMTDVSTPVSFRNFSGNWKGSYEGWLMTADKGLEHLPHSLPGLDNFYMCGQWVAIGGGLPAVLVSARDTAQIICHKDKKEFRITQVADDSQLIGYDNLG